MISFLNLIVKPVEAAWDPITTRDGAVTIQGFEYLFERILNIATGFAVFVVFIMLVVGGFKFITAGGDAKAVDGARNTITYAVIGIALLVGIWLILKFIYVFTGVNVTIFKISS